MSFWTNFVEISLIMLLKQIWPPVDATSGHIQISNGSVNHYLLSKTYSSSSFVSSSTLTVLSVILATPMI